MWLIFGFRWLRALVFGANTPSKGENVKKCTRMGISIKILIWDSPVAINAMCDDHDDLSPFRVKSSPNY